MYKEKKCFFDNPARPDKKIYIFPDVPHCLKNLRNHYLNFVMYVNQPSGDVISITREHFERLILSDNQDIKLCPKLSSIHIDCKGNDRQRVKYATQLLSDTCSKAFSLKFGRSFSKIAEVI